MKTRRSHRRSRGQVLVLAALTFLLLALSMMASFAVSHAVHERIRIQAAADSHAFTVAVLEARGFNSLGYMNRAIAGALVAEMSLHAWRSMANRNTAMYNAGFMAFIQVAAMEFAQCNPWNFTHCIHGFQALRIAMKYKRKANSTKNDIESKDSKYNEAVKGFSDMIKNVVKDEKSLVKKVSSEIEKSSGTLADLARKNSPKGQVLDVDKYNTSFLACAVEGTDIDSKCNPPSWASKGSVSSTGDRQKVMESAATAAAPIFAKGRGQARGLTDQGFNTMPVMGGVPGMDEPIDIPITVMSNPDNMMDIQSEGTYLEIGPGQTQSLGGNTVKANTQTNMVFVQWKDGFGMWTTSGSAPSDSNYDGICKDDSNCFVNFRMGPASSGENVTDYGQPSTYGAFKQSLRALANGDKGAWEIDGKGEVKSPVGDGKFKYVTDNDAYAVAKGKTYFHQFGDWSVPPNLFDPFWRAKLHNFKKSELEGVLGQVGDSTGKQVVNGGGPVEGVH